MQQRMQRRWRRTSARPSLRVRMRSLSVDTAVRQIDAGLLDVGYSHRVPDGIGHNVPQEAPEAFADAILEVGGAR